jgi:hypothetical protein
MWRVIVEDSVKGAASHFECFFHIDEKPIGAAAVMADMRAILAS